jgi:hypothetical protein
MLPTTSDILDIRPHGSKLPAVNKARGEPALFRRHHAQRRC